MRASGVLALAGSALLVGSLAYGWAASADVGFTPILIALVAILVASIAGLIRGTALYRLGSLLGVLAILVILFGFVAPLHARADIPVPHPTENEQVVLFGLGVLALAMVTGAVALRRVQALR